MAMGNDNIKGHFLGTLVRGFNLDFHSPLAEMSPLSDPICVIPYGMPVMLVANCYTPSTLVYLFQKKTVDNKRHRIFCRWDVLPATQITVSKHLRKFKAQTSTRTSAIVFTQPSYFLINCQKRSAAPCMPAL